jgi:pyrroline-5-carboxylate reductase
LEEIRAELGGAILISVAAGLTCRQIEEMAGAEVEVIRTMPNTPALAQQGCTGICSGSTTSDEGMALAWELLESVGELVEVEEAQMNALTAISGSGPAYFFYITELLAQAGVQLGLSDEQAEALAAQTLVGAASLLAGSDDPVSTLRERVTSPGGMTQAALESMEHDGLGALIARAAKAAHDRGLEMAAEAEEE